jgi:hypothetical protein
MSMEHAPLTNTSTPWGMVSPVRYRVQGNMLEFLPPTWTFPATAYYTPACPRLLTGTDTFDGFNGFEVAAIYDTCAVVLAKEESDPSFYMQQRDRIYKHIDSLAATRDQGMPDRVQDVRGDDGIGYGFGDWRFGP